MQTEVKKITPADAARLLESNTGNFRKVNERTVARYAAEMARGEWQLNGEAIKFAGSKLVDGQHRLNAIIKSGETIETLIVYLDRESVSRRGYVGDEGLKRTASQHVQSRGIKNAVNKTALARSVILHQRGQWHTTDLSKTQPIVNTEIVDFVIANNERFDQCLEVVGGCYRIAPLSVLATLCFEGTIGDPRENEIATWFMKSLCDGIDLSPTDAVLHLRNRFLGQSQGAKLTPMAKRVLITLAWNKTVANEDCKSLTWRVTGPRKQKPPEKIAVAIG